MSSVDELLAVAEMSESGLASEAVCEGGGMGGSLVRCSVVRMLILVDLVLLAREQLSVSKG